MNHINDIFTKMYPHLDIHGETIATSDLLIKEFIYDNYKMGKTTIIIIHGKGEGILKNKVHDMLKKDKLIEEFYLDKFNLGSTIIKLKTRKN